jgi:very-short-patch-repair endonuclease/ribonuclease HI
MFFPSETDFVWRCVLAQKRTYLEEKMKKALENANITFDEQVPIKDNPSDLAPKYTLDFRVKMGKLLIGIECDGDLYHNNVNARNRDKKRDEWIIKYGFVNKILRFDTRQITDNMSSCISEIKSSINENSSQSNTKDRSFVYKKSKDKNSKEIKLNGSSKLHEVNIYTATQADSFKKKHRGGVAFQLEDTTDDRFSDIFSVAFSDTNTMDCMAIVILLALKKMKKSAKLKIYTESKWVKEYGNQGNFKYKSIKYNKKIWDMVADELSKHSYYFWYQSRVNGSFGREYYIVTEADKKYRPVKSKARQECYRSNNRNRLDEVIEKLAIQQKSSGTKNPILIDS